MSQSVNGIFSNNSAPPPTPHPISDAPMHQELPPSSVDIHEQEAPAEFEYADQQHNEDQFQPLVEDEVTGPRRQPPMWKRVRNQFGQQLRLNLPNARPGRSYPEDMSNEEILHEWKNQFSDMSSELSNIKNEFARFKAEAEDLIKKSTFGASIDDHGLDVPICLPNSGTGYPSLCDPAKLKLIDFHFPPRARFSGGKHGMPVRAFLDTVTRAQNICNLRFNEFCHIMLTRCVPPALDIIQTAIHNNDDVKTIYVAFINAFDREKEPHLWQNMLLSYTIPKHHNIEKVIAEVGKLATKASFQFQSPESRKLFTDQTGLEVLKKVLPFNAVRHVEDTISKLRLQTGRSPTFHEVASGLKVKANTLDAELMAAPSSFRFAPPREFMFFDAPREKTDNRPQRYQPTDSRPPRYQPTDSRPQRFQSRVNAINRAPRQRHEQVEIESGDIDRLFKNNQYNNPNKSNYNGKQQDSRPARNNQASNRNSPDKQSHNQADNARPETKQQSVTNGKKYCVLCTGNNHDAADGCYSMRNNAGKQAIVHPAFGHCEPCFKRTGIKMFHPEAFCPLRDELLVLYREHKLRPYGVFAQFIRDHPELNIRIRPARKYVNGPKQPRANTPHNM